MCLTSNRKTIIAVGFMIVLYSSAGLARTPEYCALIAQDAKRLACYDALFRPAGAAQAPLAEAPAEPPAPAAAPPVAPAQRAAEPTPADTAVSETSPVAEAPPVSEAPPVAETSAATAAAKDAAFGAEDVPKAKQPRESKASRDDEITATITDIQIMAFGKKRFVLDNGQTWQQIEADRRHFKVGSGVTIERAGLSGYRLIADNGISTRVSRIQ
jgi:hypothetical protein